MAKCKRGHDKTGHNAIAARGYVQCRKCLYARQQEYRRRGPGAKTKPGHCRNGHELTPETTYAWGGIKYCKTCRHENYQARKLDKQTREQED